MIVFGTRCYGKTDVLDGVFDIRTQFFHVWYVPLIPIKSFLVLEELDDGSFNGAELRIQSRSMLLAWGRTASVLITLFAMISVPLDIIRVTDWHGNLQAAPLLALVGLGMMAITGVVGTFGPWTKEITEARARTLGATHLGIPEDEMSLLWQEVQAHRT